jgi:hypothetical protein
MFLLCFLLLPVPVCAQCSQLALEANPFRGTLSYARQSAPGWHVGMEVGFGFPQIDRTLFPEEGDFFDLSSESAGALLLVSARGLTQR